MPGKLYIYDNSSGADRLQAAGRMSGTQAVTRPVASVEDLHATLAALVTSNSTFSRVVFQTHAASGMIFFNHQAINAAVLRSAFAGRGYERIFPNRAKLYFDGCSVADGNAGWDFLDAVGEIFLRNGGGVAMGWTSAGIAMPGFLPWIGGNTVHPWGSYRFIDFAPGPITRSRFDSDGASASNEAAALAMLDAF
jgi:hypothetical protein